jgi:thiazole synthase
VIRLSHCFGAQPAHRVDADLAARKLSAGVRTRLAANTHAIATVARGDDLPVGYVSATPGAVRGLVGGEPGLTPVLNISHPTVAADAAVR